MNINLGKTDRLIRIIAGSVIIIVSLLYQSWWALLGVALLLNGLSGRCGGYALLGISTAEKSCEVSKKDDSA